MMNAPRGNERGVTIMVSVFGRRGFLKAAGASAAGGVVLANRSGAIAHADPRVPGDEPIGTPVVVVVLDETIQFGITDFHAVGSASHVLVNSGAALIYSDGGFLTTTIDL